MRTAAALVAAVLLASTASAQTETLANGAVIAVTWDDLGLGHTRTIQAAGVTPVVPGVATSTSALLDDDEDLVTTTPTRITTTTPRVPTTTLLDDDEEETSTTATTTRAAAGGAGAGAAGGAAQPTTRKGVQGAPDTTSYEIMTATTYGYPDGQGNWLTATWTNSFVPLDEPTATWAEGTILDLDSYQQSVGADSTNAAQAGQANVVASHASRGGVGAGWTVMVAGALVGAAFMAM